MHADPICGKLGYTPALHAPERVRFYRSAKQGIKSVDRSADLRHEAFQPIWQLMGLARTASLLESAGSEIMVYAMALVLL